MTDHNEALMEEDEPVGLEELDEPEGDGPERGEQLSTGPWPSLGEVSQTMGPDRPPGSRG
jgi:hypothetical protein